jgi:hypothetical protein
MLGAGTLLARPRAGERALAQDDEGPRILALLAAAHGRSVSPRILDNIRKALGLWRRGEKCLAQLHLSCARLPPLTRDAQAFALFVADELLKDGLSPRALMKGLGFDPTPLDLLEKYNPDQPRVPAGSGRESGQWTSSEGGGNSRQQYAQASDPPPPLRTIQPDATYESEAGAKGSLEYWRKQPTEEIIPSLKPGLDESLKVKPDGAIVNGNTRVKMLQERGFDVNMLPRESYGRAFSTGGQLDAEAPMGGGGGPVRMFPNEE